MKITLIILTTFFTTLTFASPVSIIKSSLLTDNLSQSLYIHLNPIFQNTFQQLTELVYELAEKFSQYIENRLTRSDPPEPANWVSGLFNGTNSISAQWNNHIIDFFGNIPTVYENDERSLFNTLLLKKKLELAVNILLEKLKKLFDTEINQLVISTINEFKLTKSMDRKYGEIDLDALFLDFQRQVSSVFDNTKEQLNQTINDLIDSIFTYLNSLKDQFLG